jgi:hypothetical protein
VVCRQRACSVAATIVGKVSVQTLQPYGSSADAAQCALGLAFFLLLAFGRGWGVDDGSRLVSPRVRIACRSMVKKAAHDIRLWFTAGSFAASGYFRVYGVF